MSVIETSSTETLGIEIPAIPEIDAFLLCKTPQAWVDYALKNLDVVLIDHALCEKKAASTAISLMHRYPQYNELLDKMTALAREELTHFKQVINLLRERGITYQNIAPGRYAGKIFKHLRTSELGHFIDALIIGAIIEARSCERFAALVPSLVAQGELELASYYCSLIKAEARHFEGYLYLAELYTDEPIAPRVASLLAIEQQLIQSPDTQFRFHSGVPC